MRSVRRTARFAVDTGFSPTSTVVRTYWANPLKNFGDLITPLVLSDLRIYPAWAPPGEADLLGVGSLVGFTEESFAGTIFGSGLIADTPRSMPAARTLALRGEMTRDRLGNPDVETLGDAGLLLDQFIRRPGARWDVGLVPHFIHADDPVLARWVEEYPGSVKVISVAASPQAVATQIASCRTIVSTSLHGVITADSLGIPATWLRMPEEVMGGTFKFLDHETVATPPCARGYDVTDLACLEEAADRAVAADATAISQAKEGLRRAGRRILDITPHRTAPLPQVAVDDARAALQG